MASDVVRQELESELKGIEQRFNAIQWRLDEVLSLLLTARRRASNSSSAASSTNTSPSSSPRGPSPELTSPRGKTSSSQNVKLISQASSSSSPSSPSSQSDLSPDSGKGGSSDSNSSSGRARRHRASSGKDLKDEDGDGEVGIVKDNQVDTRGKVLPTRRTSSKGKDVTPVAKKKPMSAREKRRKKQGRGRSYSADDLEEVLKMNAEGMVSDDDYYASSSSSPTSSSSSSGRTSSTSSSPSSSPHDGLTRSAGASGRTASSSSNSRKVPPIPLGQLRSQSTTDLRSSKEEADGKSRGRVRTDSRGIDRSPSQELIDISGPSSPGMSRHREWRKFIKGRTSNLLSPRQEAKFLEREKDKDKERDKDRTEKEKEREKTKDNEDEVADEEASPARHSPKGNGRNSFSIHAVYAYILFSEEGGSSPKRTFASIASEARRNAQARRCQSSDDLQVHRQILAAKKAKPPPEVPPLLLPKRNSPKANPSIASKSSSHVPHIPARGSGAVKTRSDAYKAHSALYASSPATQLVSSSSSSSSAPTKARTSSFSQPTTPDPSPRHSPKSLAVAPPPPDFVMPEMPPEVWEMIFVYIPTEEVFTTTSLVCHLWRDRLLYLVRRFRVQETIGASVSFTNALRRSRCFCL
jgi:YEATS domain-containing protein 1/3